MWSVKTSSGKVKYGEWFTDPLTGKRKRVFVTVKPTGRKSDARAAEAALKAKIRALTMDALSPSDITFKELCEKRVAWQKVHNKPQTAASSEIYLRTLSRRVGDDVLVNKLTAPYIEKVLASPSPVTYNERLKHFKSCIRWGYRNDLVSDISYLDKLQKEKEPPVREKDKYKYLEKYEIKKVLNSMNEERWRLFTEFLILSGLRIGEAIALDDSDVADEIHVNKTYNMIIGETTTTKTETSTRDIHVQGELAVCIRNIRVYVRKQEMLFGFRSDLFFPYIDGEHLNYDAYRQYFGDCTERTIGRRLTPHSLRHTHVAMLAEAGVPLETISRRLGHADSKITRDVYYHVTSKMKERENALLDKVKIL